jgi:hypothetical protein
MLVKSAMTENRCPFSRINMKIASVVDGTEDGREIGEGGWERRVITRTTSHLIISDGSEAPNRQILKAHVTRFRISKIQKFHRTRYGNF